MRLLPPLAMNLTETDVILDAYNFSAPSVTWDFPDDETQRVIIFVILIPTTVLLLTLNPLYHTGPTLLLNPLYY